MSGAQTHRVVIDPNVFVSATITPNGALGPILDLIDRGTLVPVVTQHPVDEVVDVLGRPKLAKYVQPGAGGVIGVHGAQCTDECGGQRGVKPHERFRQ